MQLCRNPNQKHPKLCRKHGRLTFDCNVHFAIRHSFPKCRIVFERCFWHQEKASIRPNLYFGDLKRSSNDGKQSVVIINLLLNVHSIRFSRFSNSVACSISGVVPVRVHYRRPLPCLCAQSTCCWSASHNAARTCSHMRCVRARSWENATWPLHLSVSLSILFRCTLLYLFPSCFDRTQSKGQWQDAEQGSTACRATKFSSGGAFLYLLPPCLGKMQSKRAHRSVDLVVQTFFFPGWILNLQKCVAFSQFDFGWVVVVCGIRNSRVYSSAYLSSNPKKILTNMPLVGVLSLHPLVGVLFR